MFTVVIRPAADPDRPMPLRPGAVIEAHRLLFLQGNIRDTAECADHYRTTFECVEMHASGQTAAIVMRSHKVSIRFIITVAFPYTRLQIDKHHYTIEFVDLMPHGKETP